jgi:hypothetical protein
LARRADEAAPVGKVAVERRVADAGATRDLVERCLQAALGQNAARARDRVAPAALRVSALGDPAAYPEGCSGCDSLSKRGSTPHFGRLAHRARTA